MTKRPWPVTFIVALLWAATAVAIVTGISLLAPGHCLDRIWALNPRAHATFATSPRASGAMLMVVGVTAAAAAAGLLCGHRWAWLLAVAIFAVNGVGDLAGLLISGDWLRSGAGALVAGLLIFLLRRPTVKSYFSPPA